MNIYLLDGRVSEDLLLLNKVFVVLRYNVFLFYKLVE